MTPVTPPAAPKASDKKEEKKEEAAKIRNVDESPKETPIGSVEDALNLKGTKELKSAEENQKKDKLPSNENAKEQLITSLAQLRDHRLKHGTPPGPQAAKEREQVKKLEEEILEKGSDRVRGSAASGEGR